MLSRPPWPDGWRSAGLRLRSSLCAFWRCSDPLTPLTIAWAAFRHGSYQVHRLRERESVIECSWCQAMVLASAPV